MKNMVKRWLQRLEEENKKSFGSEPLDCCKIGRDEAPKKAVRMTSDRPSEKR